MYSTYQKNEIQKRTGKKFEDCTYQEKETVMSKIYWQDKEKTEKFEKENNIDYEIQKETIFNFDSKITHEKLLRFNLDEKEILRTDLIAIISYSSKYSPSIYNIKCAYCQKKYGTNAKSLGHLSAHLFKKHHKILFGIEIERTVKEISIKKVGDF